MSMPKIALIHPGNAYLPELEAYRDYFSNAGFDVEILRHPSTKDLQNFAVEWHLLGVDRSPNVPGRLKIHEYISLSIPPFAKWKNRLKRWVNVPPDLRIFHNEAVRSGFGFQDETLALYRGAGVGAHFFENFPIEKKYDFVYHGAMNKSRRMHFLLEKFARRFTQYTLLLIGEAPEKLRRRFQNHKSIHFAGRVPYREMPKYLAQAHFGLNYIPDVYPYNLQPSLKLLEYCALGLPVVTTDYAWLRTFEESRGGRFFKIRPDWSNFQPDLMENFDFKTPNVADLQWEDVIARSGILEFIEHHLAAN